MANRIGSVPGTEDLFPDQSARRRWVERRACDLFERYGYGEVRVPIFERTEVFERSIGEATDVVQKEMYTFEDRGGRSLTLRPEGTASIVRAVIDRGLGEGPYRLYYVGPMFRNERPQKGRYRQFHQVGVEAIGRVNAATDAETVVMVLDLLETLGLEKTRLRINTVGSPEERPTVLAAYRDTFRERLPEMCDDCRRRFETNVLRILDCKQERCREMIGAAPSVASVLSPASRGEFERTLDLVRAAGVDPVVEPRLVRGLDYYVHTVYEVAHEGLGAQDALVGGGRYRIDLGGGEEAVGTGFALGVERLLLALDAEGVEADADPVADAYLVSPRPEDLAPNFAMARRLRAAGVRIVMDLEGRSVKAQMRSAHRAKTVAAVIRGEDERGAHEAAVRNMAAGSEERVPDEELAEALLRLREACLRAEWRAGEGRTC